MKTKNPKAATAKSVEELVELIFMDISTATGKFRTDPVDAVKSRIKDFLSQKFTIVLHKAQTDAEEKLIMKLWDSIFS